MLSAFWPIYAQFSKFELVLDCNVLEGAYGMQAAKGLCSIPARSNDQLNISTLIREQISQICHLRTIWEAYRKKMDKSNDQLNISTT